MSTTAVGLTALVVDDEVPALSDLDYLLGRDERIGEVITAASGTEALQVLDSRDVDVVFSDISMPGLDGMALARVISRFSVRPQIVFVTAHDEHAVDAFALAATDYVMKPVRAERLGEAIRRVVAAPRRTRSTPAEPVPAPRRRGRDDPRRARRRHPLHHPQPDPLRAGARRLRAAAHRPGLAPRARPAERPRGAVGRVRLRADPPQHARRAPPRQRGPDGPRALRRRVGEVELQVSRRHTKELRDTLLRRPIGDRRPSGA